MSITNREFRGYKFDNEPKTDPETDPEITEKIGLENLGIVGSPKEFPDFWENVLETVSSVPGVESTGNFFNRVGQVPLVDSILNVAGRVQEPLGILLGNPFVTQEAIARSQGIELDWGNLFNELKYQLTGDKDNPLSAEESFARPIETFDKDDYDTLLNQIAGMDFADPFFQDEIIKLTMGDLEDVEEVPEETGPGWNPNGLTNLLQDQISLINELAQTGILNAQQWQDTTLATLDSVYGDLEKDFQAQVDRLSEGELASLESLGLSSDTIASELAEMGVEGAVLSLEEQAIRDAMALQSGNQMDFAQNLVSSTRLGQADRETSAMNTFNDIIMGIKTGQSGQIGELENMAQAAQVQGQALGVDPMILFADMLYGTNIGQQQASSAAAAAAATAEDNEVWQSAIYLSQTDPRFYNDPMAAYLVLTGQLSERGYDTPAVDPQMLSNPLFQEQILAITEANPNINPGVNAYELVQAALMAEQQVPFE